MRSSFGYDQLKSLLEKYGKYLNVHMTLLDEGFEELIHEDRLPWKLRGEEAAKFVAEERESPSGYYPAVIGSWGIRGVRCHPAILGQCPGEETA